jgi:molecular chaperone GrpE
MRKSSQNTRDAAQAVEDAADGSSGFDEPVGPVDETAAAEVDSDERVSELQRELTLERDKYLRLAAEFDNFRKRTLKERSEAEMRGQADLIRQMLEPLDDIARFAHLDPAVTESATVVQGVDMVEKKFDKSLRAAGLELVNPVNEQFDPNVHEAVATEPTNDAALDHTVSQVYQVGYTFKGQLLRPARVVVRQHDGTH